MFADVPDPGQGRHESGRGYRAGCGPSAGGPGARPARPRAGPGIPAGSRPGRAHAAGGPALTVFWLAARLTAAVVRVTVPGPPGSVVAAAAARAGADSDPPLQRDDHVSGGPESQSGPRRRPGRP